VATKDTGTREADRIADLAIEDLEKLRSALVARMRQILRQLKVDDKGRLVDRQELGNLSVVRAQVLAALEDAGARQTVSVAEQRVAQAARAAERSLRDLPDEAKPDARATIVRALSGRTREIATAFSIARDRVVAAINTGSTSNASLEPLIGAISDEADIAFHRAEALVETAVISAARAMAFESVARANSALPVDLLVLRMVGPRDKKNRPFCRENVGKVFTTEAIMDLDNGQGIPVETTCGGYRCRHGWAAMSVAEAHERGLKIVGM
jgi:hypothetical protein